MRNKKLLPCPFCGGETKIDNRGQYGYGIVCISCGAKSPDFQTETNAIKSWNDYARDLIANDKECCKKSCRKENATCKKNLQLTRSDIEKMVKLKCNRGGHILYYYLQNDINLAIIYDADKNEYIVHAGNTYIHQIKTLEDAKSKLKEIVVNFICSALGVEE